MSDLTAYMAERAAEATGEDTGNSTPAPEAESAAQPAETTPQTPETETPADAGAADFLEEGFDWKKLDPQVVPLAKQLQADYTRKRQTEAEQVRQAQESLKQYEGLDPGAAAWVKQVNTLAQTHPELAAQMLKTEADRLAGQTQAPTPAADPFDGVEPLSEVERLLLEDRRQANAERQQMQQEMQQLRAARAYAEVEQQFAKLEQEAGRKIPLDERKRIADWCGKENSVNIRAAFRDLNWEEAVQRGRNEASEVVQQKTALGAAPNGVAGREAPPGAREPQTRREAIQMMVEEAQRAA